MKYAVVAVLALASAGACSRPKQVRESAPVARSTCEPTYSVLTSPGSMTIGGQRVLDYSMALVGCRGEVDRLTSTEVTRVHEAMGKYRVETCIGFAGVVHGGPDRLKVASMLNKAIGRNAIADILVYEANVLDCEWQ
jgi:hypothetical protein